LHNLVSGELPCRIGALCFQRVVLRDEAVLGTTIDLTAAGVNQAAEGGGLARGLKQVERRLDIVLHRVDWTKVTVGNGDDGSQVEYRVGPLDHLGGKIGACQISSQHPNPLLFGKGKRIQ
jgi:hypothetical protein